MPQKPTKPTVRENPISLAGIEFDEAVEGLLGVKPDKPKKKAAKPKVKKKTGRKKK